MFVGHEAVAFAAVALLARRFGSSRERALALGIAAGLFAAVPDVDMAYAPLGLLGAGAASSPLAAADAFWGASTAVHRTVTHSVLLAPVEAAAFGLAAVRSRRARVAAAVLAATLVALALAASGPLGAAVMALAVVAGGAVALLAREHLDLGPRALTATAAVGLISHPFGDLLTGAPPRFLYPLSGHLFAARPDLFGDPTLNLLGAFALELASIWAGVYAFHRVTGASIRERLHPVAATGAGYALVAPLVAPPTLAASYPFVFSVIAVGAVGALPRPVARRSPDVPSALVTGLAAVTVAGAAYGLVYATGHA